MKSLRIPLTFCAVVLAVWFAHAMDARAKQQHPRKSAAAPFQEALPLGTSRADVEKYLEDRGMRYSAAWDSTRGSWSEVVEAGKDTARCGSQTIFVDLEFESSNPSADNKPDPADRLKHVAASSSPCA
ncbi:MAG: hypothetical protein JOZ10_06675 [Acidobacteria bacterium]|nr:hypothetical protein [Acidobacteriota bacterium]MBV9434763.1 hypothetical protein [Acidobacteriota bacterium]